jgi:hypothetical protein
VVALDERERAQVCHGSSSLVDAQYAQKYASLPFS